MSHKCKHGVSSDDKVFILGKGQELRKVKRSEAEVLVEKSKATWCNREKARGILSKSKPKEVVQDNPVAQDNPNPKRKRVRKNKAE